MNSKTPALRAAIAVVSLAVFGFPVVASAGSDDTRETTAQLTTLATAQGSRDGRVRVFSGRDVLVFAVDGRAYVRGQVVSSSARFEMCKESSTGLQSCAAIGSGSGGTENYECKIDVGDTIRHSCACTDTEDCIAMIKSGYCAGHEMNCTENACTCDTEV